MTSIPTSIPTSNPDLHPDTATRASANPQPRSHMTGLLRSERQLLANPPFNDSDWSRKDYDVRWQFGVLPKGNERDCRVQKLSRVISLRTHPCPAVKH